MGATAVSPQKTLKVTVTHAAGRCGPVEVPVDRVESVYGITRSGSGGKVVRSWVGLTPTTGNDPLEPYTFIAQRRLQIAEAPWRVAAMLSRRGADLVKVFSGKDCDGNHSYFASREQIAAMIPAARDSLWNQSQGSTEHGLTVLRSGAEIRGYAHPSAALLETVFGDSAFRIPTSTGDQAAVLPEFYVGPTGVNPEGRLMIGVTLGESPDAGATNVETSAHVNEIPGVLAAGELHLETLVMAPAQPSPEREMEMAG